MSWYRLPSYSSQRRTPAARGSSSSWNRCSPGSKAMARSTGAARAGDARDSVPR